MSTEIQGSAHDLPSGRLRSFEEDDSGPDLASLLARRAPASAIQQPEPDVAMADAAAGKPADRAIKRTRSPGTAPSSPPRRPSERKNKIRPSSVQIPVALIEPVTSHRARTGRSNGEIVIDAIEHCQDRLQTLIQPRESSGGQIFISRASRGVRTTVGPLTALNIRLMEADYDVIDQLVEKYGAFSRGHLITTALLEYLTPNGSGPAHPRKDIQ